MSPILGIWIAAFLGMCASVTYDFLSKVAEGKLTLSQFNWRFFTTVFMSIVPVAAEVQLFLSNLVNSIISQGLSPNNAYFAAFFVAFSTEHIIKKQLEKKLWPRQP